jgi:Pyruvate/2-oxoacid:ferredoxin oxidoreductase delta subunit
MGHLVGKDIYRQLGKKIDGLSTRAPWNETLYNILRELYTPDEAELIARMPYSLSDLDQIEKVTKFERTKLKKLLDGLSSKGLLIDFSVREKYYYIISPLIVGIFEFTMMRTAGQLNYKEWARLFHDYLQDSKTFYKANFGSGQKVSPLRALPYEKAFDDSEHVEILDYEKASSIIENASDFGIGICSCRHEKLHAGEKKCDIPLEKCCSFGNSVDYMVRHGFAKRVSKTEMLENLAHSQENGLVLCADNVKKNISFICHCCGCCCNVLLGVSRFGYPNSVVTSSYVASSDYDTCIECGECTEACPVSAIDSESNGNPHIDEDVCLGCGVCALKCDSGAMTLVKRKQRVLHPNDTFEKIILQCLERGTLQNQMFGNPNSLNHKFMRGFVGGFLKLPPVKKALMSDTLRSSFLDFIKKGA